MQPKSLTYATRNLGLLAFMLVTITLLVVAPNAWAEKVNINKADASALMTLKGIGEKRANAIISYRKKNGNFSNAKDLLNVPGLGPEILKGIQKDLSISGGLATAPAAKKASKKAAKETKSVAKDTKKKTTDKTKTQTAKTKDSSKKSTSKASKKKDKKESKKKSATKTKSKSKSKPTTKDKKKKKKKKSST